MAGRALSAGEMDDVMLGATLGWDEDEIEVPVITDVGTLANLGKMTANAYAEPGDGDWYDLDGHYSVVRSRPLFPTCRSS